MYDVLQVIHIFLIVFKLLFNGSADAVGATVAQNAYIHLNDDVGPTKVTILNAETVDELLNSKGRQKRTKSVGDTPTKYSEQGQAVASMMDDISSYVNNCFGCNSPPARHQIYKRNLNKDYPANVQGAGFTQKSGTSLICENDDKLDKTKVIFKRSIVPSKVTTETPKVVLKRCIGALKFDDDCSNDPLSLIHRAVDSDAEQLTDLLIEGLGDIVIDDRCFNRPESSITINDMTGYHDPESSFGNRCSVKNKRYDEARVNNTTDNLNSTRDGKKIDQSASLSNGKVQKEFNFSNGNSVAGLSSTDKSLLKRGSDRIEEHAKSDHPRSISDDPNGIQEEIENVYKDISENVRLLSKLKNQESQLAKKENKRWIITDVGMLGDKRKKRCSQEMTVEMDTNRDSTPDKLEHIERNIEEEVLQVNVPLKCQC